MSRPARNLADREGKVIRYLLLGLRGKGFQILGYVACWMSIQLFPGGISEQIANNLAQQLQSRKAAETRKGLDAFKQQLRPAAIPPRRMP